MATPGGVVEELVNSQSQARSGGKISESLMQIPRQYIAMAKETGRDMRYAVRALIKSPGFALVGIISMGLGMGLTTMVYSSNWRLLTRELPAAANANRLVMPDKPVSYYYIERYREEKSLFTGVAALQTGVAFNLTFQNDANAKPERVFGQVVSADYFSVLGVQPQTGRLLSPDLDKPGDAPVVVISDRFWHNRLNSAPNTVGQILRLNGQPATIVGITPKDFNGALSLNPSEVFVPVTAPAAMVPELANDVLHQRNAREFLAMLCLAPGVTVDSAEAALDTITRRLDEQDPSARARIDKGTRVNLLSAGTMVPLSRKLKPVLVGFYVVLMGLIMAIACMNLANMLLARGANRRKELAIRLALGANRFRIIRQMIREGVLLSLLGGVLGFALAYGLASLRAHFTPPSALPVESNFTPDWHAVAFLYILAIACGVGFSLIPAFRATKVDLTPALKEGLTVQLPGYRRIGVRNLLMVAQVAGSLMLLLITGFLVVGLTQVNGVETKFDPHTMYLLSVDPMRDGYSPEKARDLFEKLPEQLKNSGPVGSIALAAQPPFSIRDLDEAGQLTGEDGHGASVQKPVIKETVGAGYFATLSEPMLAGREFSEQDQQIQADESKILPAVLNESAARGFFGNANAIGTHVKDDQQSYEVVGVIHDLKNGLGMSQPIIYLPLTQRDFARPLANGMTIMIRSDAGTDALSGIRREIAAIDPHLNIFNVQTLSAYLDLSRSSARFAVNTYGGIGIFGLALAAIGLAGVTAYAVAQRRKEVGIRMALGARKGQVLLLVMREGAALVVTGLAIGFLGAFALTNALSALTNVFVDALKVGRGDPRLLVGAPVLLAGLTLIACYVPARRAAMIDPQAALREE
jgi:macrolide transport system ATP-binding/permease protein